MPWLPAGTTVLRLPLELAFPLGLTRTMKRIAHIAGRAGTRLYLRAGAVC